MKDSLNEVSSQKNILLLVCFLLLGSVAIAQSPGNVSTSIELWLKADAGVTGTTPVTNWVNQTGGSADAIQVGDAPDLLIDQVNFNPALDFDGDDEYLQITGGILSTNIFNDIWVYSVTKTDDLNNATIIRESAANGSLSVLNPWLDSETRMYSGDENYSIVSGANIVEYNMWMHTSSTTTSTPSGTNKSISRDGTLLGAGSDNSSFVTGNDSDFLIGGGWDDGLGTSFNFNGKMAEVIIYSAVPTSLEQERIQSYLAIKYGLTKNSADNSVTTEDERDYFASDGATVIWDYSDNLTYHNDVAGIGLDVNTELDQRKSKSSNKGSIVTIDKGGVFATDKDFMVWGNDAASGISTDVTGYTVRTNKVWKVAITGTPGDVSFEVDISTTGLDLLNGTVGDFALLIDADGVFATGATVHTTGASLNDGILSFTDVTFADGDFFAIAGPEGIAPGNVIENLALWLKADVGVTGAAPVTAWVNQAGSSTDAIQVGDAPDLLTDQVNFNPALYFDGNDEYLQITGGILGTNTFSDVWVYSVTKADDLNNATLIRESAASGRFSVLNPWLDSETRIYLGDETYSTASDANIVEYNMWTHASSITTDTPSGTNKSISKDGVLLGAGSDNSSIVTGNGSDFIIGGGWDDGLGSSNNFNGKMAEVIIYTGVPTPLEQERIQSYLAIKYGLTKNSADNGLTVEDERDYFASDGTTVIWDYSVNSAYHNDVVGIGRDDDTQLEQQKTKSSSNGSIVTIDKGGAFTSDKDFMVWGNDAASGTSTDVTGYAIRTNSVWKVAVTGAPGDVSFEVDLSTTGLDLLNGTVGDFALLIDDDGIFASGATDHTTGATLSDGILSFTDVTFADGDFFAIAGPEGIAPGDVTENLTLWLKADVGVTGTTTVTNWVNQAGGSADAIQVGDAPELLTDQVNFNPALYFDGNDEYLQITGGILDANIFSDVWVYSVTKADELNSGTLIRESAANGSLSVLNPWLGSDVRIYTGEDTYSTASGANIVEYNMWTHASSISTDTPSGTKKSISKDGALLGAGSDNSSVVIGDGSDFIIGGGWDDGLGSSNNLNGKMAEVIIYSGVPSSLEQERIQSYLAIKYGITKNSADDADTTEDEQDYFASDGTTVIWDYSNNSAYHNDVVGIGRDDDTALEQKQSSVKDDTTKIYISSLAADNASNGGTIGVDKSFVVLGHLPGIMASTTAANTEVPTGVVVRIEREWQVVNTNYAGTFNIDWQLNSNAASVLDVSHLRLLVDDDGDFSNASIYNTTDGITITESGGNITIGSISTSQIPENSIRYVTLGSVDASSSLPITLSSFDPVVNNETRFVEISWKTSSEINNDYFTIERSKDATNWEAVKDVGGAGNSSSVLNYSINDETPHLGESYYRLKQTDFDGQFSYSDIKSVNLESLGNTRMHLYPNPANDQITIVGKETELMSIAIYNTLGQDVTDKIKTVSENDSKLVIDLSKLNTGLYYLKTKTTFNKVYKE